MKSKKRLKRLTTAGVSATLVLCMGATAFALTGLNPKAIENKIDNDLYTYSQNGYVFEKISHADVPTGQNDGWVDYYEYVGDDGKFHNGVVEHTYTSADLQAMKDAHPEIDWDKIGIDTLIGDGCQSYTYSAVAYGDDIYMGSMYGGIGVNVNSFMALVGGDKELATALVEYMYNGEYYQEHINGLTGEKAPTNGVLVKLNVVTGECKVLMAGSLTGEEPTMRGGCLYNDKIYFLGSVLTHAEGEEGAGAGGMPSIYEVDPRTDEVKLVYQATDQAGYGQMVQKGVFPTLRTIIDYKGSLIASVTDEKGAHFIAFTPDEDDFDKDGNFKGIPVPEAIRNPEFHEIAAQDKELFDYPAYLTKDSNYGGTVYQVIEYNGDLYALINSGRASLGTAVDASGKDTGCYRGWALVRGKYDASKGSVATRDAWTWEPIVGNTADDQWEGNDNARYTFNVDPDRFAPGTATMMVYNDYLYIGDYNDVTQATFGALGGLAGNASSATTPPLRHLATNLKQSINLYRFDKDMDVEMVVGDPTKMFPEGSITGMHSGYTSHSNQYTSMAHVYDNDKSDNNDGILFYGTLDEGTILTPFVQISNGELIHMSKDEWKTKLERLAVIINLLGEKGTEKAVEQIQKNSAEYGLDANMTLEASDIPEDVIDEKLAADIVTDVVDETKQVDKLSKTEVKAIAEDIVSGEIEVLADVLDDSITETFDEINDNLVEMTDLIDATGEKDPEGMDEFAEMYSESLESYSSVKDLLPESIRAEYDKLLNVLTRDNLNDLGTILYYLKDSVRGCDVYAITTDGQGSRNSMTITTVTNNGMGDFNNHTMRNFATTDDYMMFLTGNPIRGAQSWRMIASPAYQNVAAKTYSHVNHHFEEVEHVDAEYGKDGYVKYECKECTETKTEMIEKLPASNEEEDNPPAKDDEVTPPSENNQVKPSPSTSDKQKPVKIQNADKVNKVKTGDTAPVAMLVLVNAVAAVVAGVVIKKRRHA